MHFGIARAHAQAAPPNSINTTPVDNERVFVITHMAQPLSGNKMGGEA
jgi:hypothetical protein